VAPNRLIARVLISESSMMSMKPAFRSTFLLSNLHRRAMSSSSHDGGACGASPNIRFVPIEDVESLERYRFGGYHPTTIGDLFRNRYHIVHKLGFGTNSTTWLAHEQKKSAYVAVKISIAENEQKECAIMSLLMDTNPAHKLHPGSNIVLPLLDTFNITSPNGTHTCTTTIPARASVADAQDASYNRLFHPRVARVIVAQLIQAVAYLHSRGVVHSGLQLF
jgi:serine/threonine-protein kinase SRPK3